MDWRTVTADKPEGALRSNPFEGFEAYAMPPVENLRETPAEEKEEGDIGPRGGDVSGDTNTYNTVK
jgi:hypothetical protein